MCHLQKIFITFSRVCQIQDLGQSKHKLRLFLKRTHGISKILFNLGSCELLAILESKIRKCLFFDGSLLEKDSVMGDVIGSGSVTDCLLKSFTDLERQTELRYVG